MGNGESKPFPRRFSFGRSSFKGTYSPMPVRGASLLASQGAKEQKLQLDRYWIGASVQRPELHRYALYVPSTVIVVYCQVHISSYGNSELSV